MQADRADATHARLRFFRAPDDHDACIRFARGRRGSLTDHHTAIVTSLDTDWFDNPNVWVCMLDDDDGEALAGGRVHVADGLTPLPSERAYPGAELRAHVARLVDAGTCEYAGLWVAPRVSRTGVAPLMCCVLLAVSDRLHMTTALCICADHSRKLIEQMGMRVATWLGERGTFQYPTPDVTSYFLTLRDLGNFDVVTPRLRGTVIDLRERLSLAHRVVELDVDLRSPTVMRVEADQADAAARPTPSPAKVSP